ncbi:hypothetical protein BC343_11005 [Mucilaginibacter pedocola]|uniref:Beta-lactamase-related domain-containing protein n=1 Tax=Mucilaginibacter pedocola TaxID=1792845 RepID=A0A1S9PBR7_9SPHI|nr:hypothetical protein BC343_11005 [Mucilaginibacter pedocola]
MTGFSHAQTRTQRFDSLFNYLKVNEDFNGNVLFAEKGKVVYKKCIGYANFKTKARLSENSMFELASLSKQFTAMGIMILMERGKLSYADTLGKFFKGFPYGNLTIRPLLNHTSGVPDYMDLFEKHWDKSKTAHNKDVIALLSKYHPAVSFKPGETFEYSNTGYALLASVIEKVSGQTYAEFLKQNIFMPLQMTRTRVYNTRRSKKEVIPNYAYGYIIDEKTKKPTLPDDMPDYQYVKYLDGITGDGTVNSTIIDLLKWDRALYTTKLVKAATLAEAFEPVKFANGGISGYGFGWGLRPDNPETGRETGHNGAWAGYDTHIGRYIDRDKTIIILRNITNQNEVSGVYEAYTDVLFGKPLVLPKITHPGK